MKTALMISFLLLGQTFNIELAVTPIEQATGLMYRKEWKDNSQGMLFVNNTNRQVSFWMKNTYLNLTMLYLDKDFKILEVHHPEPLNENSVASKTDQVQYILEINPILEIFVIKNWNAFSKLLQENLNEKEHSIIKLKQSA